MSEQVQVGDTVRLTITAQGEVSEESGGGLVAGGYFVYAANTTVEILSRATPPLPSEPGTWWLDCNDYMWTTTSTGVLFCPGKPATDPHNYAPFRQLVLK